MSVGYFASQVKFEEDIAKILPKDKKIEKLNEVFQNSKFLDKLVVMVSLKDTLAEPQPDSLIAYADSFTGKIQENLGSYIKKINGKILSQVMDLQTIKNLTREKIKEKYNLKTLNKIKSSSTIRNYLKNR